MRTARTFLLKRWYVVKETENYLRTSVNCYCNKLRHYVTSRSITTLAPQIVSDPFVELLNKKCCGRTINGSSKRKVSGFYKESGEHRKKNKYLLSDLAALFVF
jgi:hypothetical protein